MREEATEANHTPSRLEDGQAASLPGLAPPCPLAFEADCGNCRLLLGEVIDDDDACTALLRGMVSVAPDRRQCAILLSGDDA